MIEIGCNELEFLALDVIRKEFIEIQLSEL